MTVQILRGDARHLPISDASVDLIVSSPPYWSLRAYQDNGETYDGQIGAEATPAEFVDALIECTREWMRVVKPSGSIWVNLGDKFLPSKSLAGIPWRYAIRCIDDLGLILRAEVIWSKPNGLPESVTDRVRRSHEQWFHMTLNPRYFSAVDLIREPHDPQWAQRRFTPSPPRAKGNHDGEGGWTGVMRAEKEVTGHPLGKLPGSVWTIATEPLRVPDHLGIDHFAAFPTEFPRRIITGWSPRGVCVECGAGRRPVVEKNDPTVSKCATALAEQYRSRGVPISGGTERSTLGPGVDRPVTLTGEACACPEPTAPTTPGVVLDPFGGTGTTALVADALGRHGISVDMSADYCRLATWRTSDPKQRAKAARREFTPPAEQIDGQAELFDIEETA